MKFNKAIITGCTGSLARAFSLMLAEQGAELVLIARNTAKLEQLQNELDKYNIKITTFLCDFCNLNEISNLVDEFTKQRIDADLLINNIGYAENEGLGKMKFSSLNEFINANIISHAAMTNYFISQKSNYQKRYILNIGSSSIFSLKKGYSLYSSAKSFIYTLTKSSAKECKNADITYSVVCPSAFYSDFDIKSGIENKHRKKLSAEYIASYSLNALAKGKTLILPGIKAKCAYLYSKLFN